MRPIALGGMGTTIRTLADSYIGTGISSRTRARGSCVQTVFSTVVESTEPVAGWGHQEGTLLYLLIKAASYMHSSNRSTLSLTAMAGWEGYSLPSCSVPRKYCANLFSTSASSSRSIGAFTMTVSMRREKAKTGRRGSTSSYSVRDTANQASRSCNELRSNSRRLTHIFLYGNISKWQYMSRLILLG